MSRKTQELRLLQGKDTVMPKWTNAQRKAIETRGKTLLISAAAGSGKTTVLIERIIRSITEPDSCLDISRMLIVTFTRAAAAELKQRISKALSNALAERPNDRRLFKQLSALGSAHISTIDSFYSDVVRKNSNKLGIPSNLRISDDSEMIKIRKRIMNEVIDLGYSGELSISADKFAVCAESLCDMRNDSKLYEVFFDLYEKLLSNPRGIEYLSDCADAYDGIVTGDFFSSRYGAVIADYVKCELEFFIRALESALDYFSGYEVGIRAAFSDDLDFCKKLLELIDGGNYEKTCKLWNTYSPTRLKSPKGDDKTGEAEYFCELRGNVKDKIRKLGAMYFGAGYSPQELQSYANSSAERCRTLHAVLSKFNELYSEEKLTLGVAEFSDIKLWAYKLLVNPDTTPTELALGIAESFDCVYIDEYQDVDEVQDLIFRAVSKPCARFMVGDVKQSIYRFRGAEPSLFMNYRNAFAPIDSESDTVPSDADCTIFMSENFRCDKTIITCANEVCSYLFKTGSLNIDYKDEDDLHFSKDVEADHKFNKVKITLLEGKKATSDLENAEAAYVASEINRLINEEKKADGSPIEAKDIAVLSRGYPFCLQVGSALDKYGIKHSSSGPSNIFDDPEVSLALSLLNVIDNPMRDIYLAAVMLSPLFRFSADEIIAIKKTADSSACALYDTVCEFSKGESESAAKCRSMISALTELRDAARSLSADKVIRLIYDRFSFIPRANENSSTSDALIALYENARNYEGDTFKGLYSYLKYIQEIIDNNLSLGKGGSDTPDGVQLMTMHKSKGLEFPVCFVSGCGKPFNRDDAKDLLLYSSKLGIATDLSDETGFGRIRTPYRKALSRFILNESAEEEMRVLYVALTRARERLYVTADPRYGTEREFSIAKSSKRYGGRAAILDANNYISWIISSLYESNIEEDTFELSVIPYDEVAPLPEGIKAQEFSEESSKIVNEEIFEAIKRNLDYEYPYLHIANLPAKLSVSKLTPNVLDRTEDAFEKSEESIDIKLPSVASTPLFMGCERKASAAEKGIATHTFLQFCDFENAEKSGVDAELSRLVRFGFMDNSMSELVNKRQIAAFFQSSLYNELSSAKRIYREQRFNILLSAKDFTEDEEYAKLIENEKLLVQGVIDIFFESKDGQLILCDYKTDHLTPEEINDKALVKKKLSAAHSRQLSYYSAALTEICGRRPDKVLIYSLPLCDSVEIDI